MPGGLAVEKVELGACNHMRHSKKVFASDEVSYRSVVEDLATRRQPLTRTRLLRSSPRSIISEPSKATIPKGHVRKVGVWAHAWRGGSCGAVLDHFWFALSTRFAP